MCFDRRSCVRLRRLMKDYLDHDAATYRISRTPCSSLSHGLTPTSPLPILALAKPVKLAGESCKCTLILAAGQDGLGFGSIRSPTVQVRIGRERKKKAKENRIRAAVATHSLGWGMTSKTAKGSQRRGNQKKKTTSTEGRGQAPENSK